MSLAKVKQISVALRAGCRKSIRASSCAWMDAGTMTAALASRTPAMISREELADMSGSGLGVEPSYGEAFGLSTKFLARAVRRTAILRVESAKSRVLFAVFSEAGRK